MLDLLLTEWVTRMKLGSNSVEDHPQLSHNRHPVDGALVYTRYHREKKIKKKIRACLILGFRV
jgi:hypothetical protein